MRDVTVTYPEDPFLLVLLHLAKAICRSADEIYGQRHESLLQMWKTAKSISNDLREYDCLMRQALGFGLDRPRQQGVLGVRQTVLVTRELIQMHGFESLLSTQFTTIRSF